MAHATHLTISTADRIRLDANQLDANQGEHDTTYDEDRENEVRQEVQVSVTYALEPGDTNLVVLAERKALEVKLAHEAVWNRIGAFSNGAFSGSNSGRINGSGLGRCSGRYEADEAKNDKEDEYDDPDDNSDDDPLAGLPHRGDDPFGGGPVPAGAARPYPDVPNPGVPIGLETQNGNGVPPQGGRYLPDASSKWNGNGSPVPASEPVSEPDAEPVTGPQKILIRSRAGKIGLTPYALESLLYQQFKVWRVERLTKDQAASVLAALERDLKEQGLKEKNLKEKNGKEGIPHADDAPADRSSRAATA